MMAPVEVVLCTRDRRVLSGDRELREATETGRVEAFPELSAATRPMAGDRCGAVVARIASSGALFDQFRTTDRSVLAPTVRCPEPPQDDAPGSQG